MTDRTLPAVYRAPQRSRDVHVPAFAGVHRALDQGLCGMGGALATPPESADGAVARLDTEYGERVARRVLRFAGASDGSWVWTRDEDEAYWVGRLAGPWRYDGSPAALAADLVHVRACTWGSRPLGGRDVPAAVLATFARGGLNWQRIRASDVSEATARAWPLVS
ncbi:hypothetical protein [Demequina globuliformis]|uniref:hypothetical protein n=1 Tax=Demequina globuliformis TaxID=676202 RepID=UPI000780FA75|nr:hypothetical protein [Demequina globuliformis]